MTQTTTSLSAAAIAIALGTAFASMPAAAQNMDKNMDKEKCYGVALKGKNDCKAGAGTTCAGSSKMDYQGNAFSLIPKGTCDQTESKTSSTGHGQLMAFKEKM